MTRQATDLTFKELIQKETELNQDLATIAQTLHDRLKRFNDETYGWGVDVNITVDWEPIILVTEAFGRWIPVRVTIGAKSLELPNKYGK